MGGPIQTITLTISGGENGGDMWRRESCYCLSTEIAGDDDDEDDNGHEEDTHFPERTSRF